MDIKQINFIKSSPDLKTCPPEGPPEYVFAGRSNVGKSSLLNLLAGKKNLAKTSSTPGKTKLINHYLVDETWYLVDLPGYGFARTGKQTRSDFMLSGWEFIQKRKTLACLFILIDCRHHPLESDLTFINLAGENQVPLSLIFTKTDKISGVVLERNLNIYRNTLLQTWEELPPFFTTSSLRRTGREEILDFIDESNRNFLNIL